MILSKIFGRSFDEAFYGIKESKQALDDDDDAKSAKALGW
jgi:hypothetical protein